MANVYVLSRNCQQKRRCRGRTISPGAEISVVRLTRLPIKNYLRAQLKKTGIQLLFISDIYDKK